MSTFVALTVVLAAASPVPFIETLEDGSTLVFVQMKGERMSSVRYVVRSGAANEPPTRAGLAHLLEHLVMQGTYDQPEGTLFDAVRGAGGYVNAHTTADWTSYEIDIPKDRFQDIAPMLLRTATSPALPFAAVEREKGVVDAEHFDRGDVRDWLWAIDHLVYPGANAGVNVIGSEKSRRDITPEDLQQFVEQNYVPENTVIVVAGDLEHDAVKDLVQRSVLSAPFAPGPKPPEVETPNIPSEAKHLSWVTMTLHARLVDGVDRPACETAAALATLRLRQRIVIDDGISASTGAFCYQARGHQLLVLAAFSLSPDSSNMPDELRAVVRDSATRPASAHEQAIVVAWHKAQRERLVRDPTTIANALAYAAGQHNMPVNEAIKRVFETPKFAWGSTTKVFALANHDNKLAEIHFSRFEE